MKIFQLVSIVVFSCFFNLSLHADFFPNQESGIQINLPPFWKTKASAKSLQSSPKDNLVILRMSSTSAKTLPLKLKSALQDIQEQLVDIEYTTSPDGTTRSLNDLKVTYIEGKGINKKSKKPSQWSVAVATHKQTATISIIATNEGNEKHASVIGKIVQSLSKIE
jgi:ABC-type metal ion transport system substrate-binding protein